MSAYEYHWKSGARLRARLDPQVVGEHCHYLEQTYGRKVATEKLVDDARNPESPLHQLFTWDDGEAAEQWRLHEARKVMASITVTYRDEPDGEPKTVRAFVSVRDDEGKPHYSHIFTVMSDDEKRRQVLRKAWEDAKAFKKKYADLAELAEVLGAIDEMEGYLPPIIRGEKPLHEARPN